MKVRYAEAATTEATGLLARIADDNLRAAVAVARSLREAARRLQRFPHMGTRTDEPGTFVTIARPYRYLIFYSIQNDTVVIRNVRHPARQRPAERS